VLYSFSFLSHFWRIQMNVTIKTLGMFCLVVMTAGCTTVYKTVKNAQCSAIENEALSSGSSDTDTVGKLLAAGCHWYVRDHYGDAAVRQYKRSQGGQVQLGSK